MLDATELLMLFRFAHMLDATELLMFFRFAHMLDATELLMFFRACTHFLFAGWLVGVAPCFRQDKFWSVNGFAAFLKNSFSERNGQNHARRRLP